MIINMNKKQRLYTLEEVTDELYPTPEAKAQFEKELEVFREENRKLVLAELGAKIRKARLAACVTQAGLAQKLNTDKANISRMEHGKQNLTVETIYRIAHILGQPVQIEF